MCHHDPLLPPVVPATDVTAAETALRRVLGSDRYLTFAYNDPVQVFA